MKGNWSWPNIFGSMLADTIENARIMHFSRTKTRNLHALYEVSKSFTSVLDANSVMETALKTAADLCHCDSSYLALVEEEIKRDFGFWHGVVIPGERKNLNIWKMNWLHGF